MDPNQFAAMRGTMTTPARKSIVSGLFANASASKVRHSLAPGDVNSSSTAANGSTSPHHSEESGDNEVVRTLADELTTSNENTLELELAQARKLNAEYENKIGNLTEMYVAEHNRLLKLKAEHDEATKDSRAMYADFLAKKTELGEALERCAALQAKLASAAGVSPAAAAQVADLTAQRDAARAEVTQLADSLVAQRTATQQAEHAQADLATQLKSLETLCQQHKDALHFAQEEIALMQQVEQQREQDQREPVDILDLRARTETLQIQNELLRDELASLRAEGDAADKLRAEMAAQREQYEGELAEIKRTQRRERVELTERVAAAERAGETDRAALADERAARKSDAAAHAAEMERALAAATSAASERRDSTVARVAEERDELVNKLAALEVQLAQLQAARTMENESASSVAEERDTAQRAAAQAEAEAQALRSTKATLESDLHTLYRKHKSELAKLEEEFRQSDYKARYESVVSERDELRTRVDAAMQLAERVTRLGGLEDAFGAEVARAAVNVQSRYEAIARADERWQTQAARAEARARDCELRTAAMQRECDQLRTLQASHTSVVASLEASVSAARAQMAAASQAHDAERESMAHELIEAHEREAAISERLRDSQATLAQLRAEQQELAEFVEEERQIRQDEYNKLEAAHNKTLALLNEARAAAEAAVHEAALREAAALERAAATRCSRRATR
jgi:chromosome segregation ATPase